MGLDMYLSASKYVSTCCSPDDNIARCSRILADIGVRDVVAIFNDGPPDLDIKFTVVYWRKANQIHQWFVDNVQGGRDECQEVHVSREQLTELLALCQKAKNTKDASLLEPQDGCFFGSTDIDDAYWADLDYTIERLAKVLGNATLAGCELSYRASW